MPSINLSGWAEEGILALLLTSQEHAPRLTLELTPTLFSTAHCRKIAKTCFDYIEKYGRPPGPHIRELLEDELRRGEGEGKAIKDTLDDIYELIDKGLQPEFVLAKLADWIKWRNIILTIRKAEEAALAGDIDAAEEALHSPIATTSTDNGIWLSDTERMLSFLNQPDSDVFPSGVKVLDNKGARPGRKQLFVIIGSRKSGKSWWLIQIGKEANLERKSVLHITLEMSAEYTAERYIQALFAMTSQEAKTIRVPIFKKNDQNQLVSIEFDTRIPDVINQQTRPQVAEKLRMYRNRAPLLIKEFPTASLTVPRLTAYLDQLERQGFKPDILILDYLKLMANDKREQRLSLGRTAEEIRGLAVARNMAIATGWQGNRGSAEAKTVTGMHVAEDWSLLGTADITVTISKTAGEAQRGLARVLVDSARRVEDKYSVMITQSYDTGQFCLDSVYMNKFSEEERKRVSGEEEED